MDRPGVCVNSSAISSKPEPENIDSPALLNRGLIGDVAESLSRTFLRVCKQSSQADFSSESARIERSDAQPKRDLMAVALDILSTSDFPEAFSAMALATSRNSDIAPRIWLSQFYKARNVRELPELSGLKLSLSNELKLMKALAGLAEQFADPLLNRKKLNDTEKANLSRSLNKLAGVAMLLLKPLVQGGDLYKLEALTLNSMQGLLNKAPNLESGKFRNALNHAISKQSTISAVRLDSSAYSSVSEVWRNDLDVSLAAINQNANLLEYASDELKNDRTLVFAAAKKSSSALQYASPRLRAEFELTYPPTE